MLIVGAYLAGLFFGIALGLAFGEWRLRLVYERYAQRGTPTEPMPAPDPEPTLEEQVAAATSPAQLQPLLEPGQVHAVADRLIAMAQAQGLALAREDALMQATTMLLEDQGIASA